MQIRKATPADNTQLLQLTADSGMEGSISLRIERDPDFFSLLDKRGENTTFVAEKNNKIIGCYSVSKSKVLINKNQIEVHYVSDLKIDNKHRGGLAGYRLVHKMKEYLIRCDADLVMCVVAKGNDKMDPFLTGRTGIPGSQSIGFFKIFQLLPSKKLKKMNSYHVVESKMTEEHIKLFNSFQEGYQLGKIITSDMAGSAEQVLTIRESNEIVASLSLRDTSDMKQNVVFKVNPVLKYLLYFSKAFGLSVPTIGEPIRMLYVNNFFCKSGYEDAFEILLHYGKNLTHKKNYHFISIGIHSKDPINNIMDRFRKFTFYSQGYITSLKNNQNLIDDIINGIPFEDYSLV
jgi:N-acetylglutamate synthase-like GNAT family acetyltransferase